MPRSQGFSARSQPRVDRKCPPLSSPSRSSRTPASASSSKLKAARGRLKSSLPRSTARRTKSCSVLSPATSAAASRPFQSRAAHPLGSSWFESKAPSRPSDVWTDLSIDDMSTVPSGSPSTLALSHQHWRGYGGGAESRMSAPRHEPPCQPSSPRRTGRASTTTKRFATNPRPDPPTLHPT